MPSTLPPRRSVERPRTVTIQALDGAGGQAAGAELRFESGDVPFGAVTVGAGAVRLDFQDAGVTLRVTAHFWGEIASALLPPGVDRHTFRFRAVSRGIYAGPGTARCPDGTAGQPCVDCIINGSVIRICG